MLMIICFPIAFPVSLVLDKYLQSHESEEDREARRGLLCG